MKKQRRDSGLVPKPGLVQRRDLLLEPSANDGTRAEPITLDPETRARFVQALAEMIVESMLRQRHGQAK